MILLTNLTVTTKHMKWIPIGNQAQIVSIDYP